MGTPEIFKRLGRKSKLGLLLCEARAGDFSLGEMVELLDALSASLEERAALAAEALDALGQAGIPAGRLADLRATLSSLPGAAAAPAELPAGFQPARRTTPYGTRTMPLPFRKAFEAAEAHKPADPRPAALVAEPDPRVRATLRARLEQRGFRVIEADNGEEAWARLAAGGSEPVELAVLNMRLAKLNGPEFVARLNARRGNLPAVVCTAYEQVREGLAATGYPRLFYLKNPADDALLAQTLQSLTAGQKPT